MIRTSGIVPNAITLKLSDKSKGGTKLMSKTGQEFINEVFTELQELFLVKQKEYKAASDSVFRNFEQGANLSGESPEETLLGYVNKQIVSLFDAKKTNPERLRDVNFIDEKAGDIAVYMIILRAMVRYNAQEKNEIERIQKVYYERVNEIETR